MPTKYRMDDFEIEAFLKQAKDIAHDYHLSWQGGFATKTVNAIEELQRRNKALETALHNEQCSDEEIIWCECGREHPRNEIAGQCSGCGGAVSGIVMFKQEAEFSDDLSR